MTSTVLGWLLVTSAIAISALLIFPPGAPRLALLSRRRSSAGAIVLLLAGIGAATLYWGNPPKATGSRDRDSSSLQGSGPDSEALARLKDYARSIGTEQAAADKLLPDVGTMVERLAARLETAPEDVKGWRMLGWSYYHTGRYKQAAAALARAIELDPNSAEFKQAYEEAKKASEGDNSQTASTVQAEAVGKGDDGPHVGKVAKSEAPHGHGPEVRAMVDGLANRLERSPRDVEGWTRLMRSRVVLGEKDVAATALRKALEVFKDDSAATGKITAAATELGLQAK